MNGSHAQNSWEYQPMKTKNTGFKLSKIELIDHPFLFGYSIQYRSRSNNLDSIRFELIRTETLGNNQAKWAVFTYFNREICGVREDRFASGLFIGGHFDGTYNGSRSARLAIRQAIKAVKTIER